MTADRPSPAVVLLSGGLDSTTVLAMVREDGFTPYALTVNYGQRHAVELEAARDAARRYGAADHAVIDVDLRRFGGSALTGPEPVPRPGSVEEIGREIPATYVPARNTILLSLALAWAETLAARDIFVGVNALDYSGYPDCRPAFIQAFAHLATVATRAGVAGRPMTIHTPLITLTKAEIIARGTALGVDYARTVSCYDPGADGSACGACDACLLRRRGFEQAGVPDSTRYRTPR